MAINRYDRTSLLRGGRMLATPENIRRIQRAVRRNNIMTKTIILKEGERLDHIAGKVYGNGQLWWVIAAASGIGWGLQVPPGTRISVPVELSGIAMLVS
jgi:nucleoid-associated protein YgaU